MPRKLCEASPPVGNGSVGITQLRMEAAPQIVDVTLFRIELNRQVVKLHRLMAMLQLCMVFALITEHCRRCLALGRISGPPATKFPETGHNEDAHDAGKAGNHEAMPDTVPRSLKNTLDQCWQVHDTSNAILKPPHMITGGAEVETPHC